jgi:hypothetical protein
MENGSQVGMILLTLEKIRSSDIIRFICLNLSLTIRHVIIEFLILEKTVIMHLQLLKCIISLVKKEQVE